MGCRDRRVARRELVLRRRGDERDLDLEQLACAEVGRPNTVLEPQELGAVERVAPLADLARAVRDLS